MMERFTCPPSLAPHMVELFAGEYDLLAHFTEAPVVVDIGACVGAFARWVQQRFPGAEVHCYEPNPRVHNMLDRNVAIMSPVPTVHRLAVTVDRLGEVALYAGRNNVGETSTNPNIAGTDEGVMVPTVPIDDLPPCDVLKLDCEGNEPELLQRYCLTHERPAVVLLEYHSPTDAASIIRLANWGGWRIAKWREHSYGRGVICMRHEPKSYESAMKL